MTAAHSTWLADEDDGTVTAMCHSCNWQGTERVSNRDWAAQEANLHTAIKPGRTWPCPASDTYVEAEHEGAERAVCPYCDLTVDVRPSYVSMRTWRYMPHPMILDDDIEIELSGWWETTKAAVAGGTEAVRRLNDQARIQAMSAVYREQRGKAS